MFWQPGFQTNIDTGFLSIDTEELRATTQIQDLEPVSILAYGVSILVCLQTTFSNFKSFYLWKLSTFRGYLLMETFH